MANHWTRDELLLALNLYHQVPFGKQHSTHPPIVALAEKIGRTPGAVAMKLSNFTSLDPVERARGIKGLSGASKSDRAIWAEFENDLESLVQQSEDYFFDESTDQFEKIDLSLITEAESVVKVRRNQSFFRRVVLGSYGQRCCITGNPIPELLRASHIIPWKESEELRIEPSNGLCLAATFDAAFDRGLISFDHEYRMLISSRLEECRDPEIHTHFVLRKGQPLRLPEKNLPTQLVLEWHRNHFGFSA